jgi:hypothetical protein
VLSRRPLANAGNTLGSATTSRRLAGKTAVLRAVQGGAAARSIYRRTASARNRHTLASATSHAAPLPRAGEQPPLVGESTTP